MEEEEFTKLQKEGKVEEIKEEKVEEKEPEEKLPSTKPTLEDYEPFLEELRREEVGGGGNYLNQIIKDTQFSTVSLTFVDVTDLTITVNVGLNKRVLLLFNSPTRHSADLGINYLTFSIDGTDQGGTEGLIAFERVSGEGWNNISMMLVTDKLAMGSHTFKVRMKVSANTGLLVAAGTRAIFMAIELT